MLGGQWGDFSSSLLGVLRCRLSWNWHVLRAGWSGSQLVYDGESSRLRTRKLRPGVLCDLRCSSPLCSSTPSPSQSPATGTAHSAGWGGSRTGGAPAEATWKPPSGPLSGPGVSHLGTAAFLLPAPAAGARNRWAGMWVASWSHWGSPTWSLGVGAAVEAGGCGSLWFIPVLESREEGTSVQGLLTFPETLTSDPSLYSIAWCAALLCPVCPPDHGHCSLYTLGLAPTPNALPPRSSYM